MTAPTLALAGTYHREVAASLARVWENVFDWEHLPALHASSFAAVELLARGASGWRVRLVPQPGDASRAQVLELEADRTNDRYRVVTTSGPGRGSEIRVRLLARAPHATGVVVEFHVVGVAPERLAAVGQRYVELYTQLWDEDEAMMVERERACARRTRPRPEVVAPQHLGDVGDVLARAPFVVEFAGERFRIVVLDGALLAHAATCPHWLGPLDVAPIADGCVRCPWHGYVFDVRSGACVGGAGLRLAAAPRIAIENGAVVLHPAAPD